VQEIPTHHLLWAKLGEGGRYHPLICHLIDVAEVAQELWNAVLTDGIRSHLATLLGTPPEQCGSLLSLWVGLHDLGKASPAFQRRDMAAVERLTAVGLTFPRVFVRSPCPHATISATVLGELLQEETGLEVSLSRVVARTLGGHHGTYPLPGDLLGVTSHETGGEEWAALRRELLLEMMGLLPPGAVDKELARLEVNTLVVLLSGLCVVADWVGSMEQYFPFADNLASSAEYAQRAGSQARRALRELGWVGWSPPTTGVSFEDLCSVGQPRPMQEAVIALAEELAEPSLVIIEAPTGVGKTEAALYLADHWAVSCQQRGLYVAMPTMATSNQMFTRVRDVLVRRYANSLVNLHLVHSQARWREDLQRLQLETIDESDDGAAVAAMSWFLPRKRTLLAPFGVGTVDQALLSVLQTRHFFLRLFGLSHKTVIFDEVHAYDTYMSSIFQRLLGWLRLLGASVVILSATLPRRTRRELVEAYLGGARSFPEKSRYPSLVWAMGERSGLVPLKGGKQRRVALEWVDREPEAIASLLRSELSDGGCAAVICNTVARSQEVYGTLREAGFVERDDLHLFHARFPLAWRQEIEEGVLADFGKDDRRPSKAVVVATQVIEQSLDLDFDLMISDLAPADLLIQRAGRLHRHRREARPARCSQPRLIIARPEAAGVVPDFGVDAHVYERYVLLRSYLALRGHDTLTLPDDTEALIETVYGEEDLPADVRTPELEAELARALEELIRHEEKDVFQARSRLVPAYDTDDLLDQRSLNLEEDNPDLHRSFQALTRLAPPGISLVCLHRTGQGLALRPDGSGPVIQLEEEPDEQVTRALAQHAIKVTNWPVVEHFLARRPPSAWKDSPALRFHRLGIFDCGVCALEGTSYVLRLTRELGLEVDKEGGVDEGHV
jgi:CRISPR-associated endonuclease/helicase Cas3